MSEPPAEALLLLGHSIHEELWLYLAYVWGSQKAQVVEAYALEYEPLAHARHMPWLELWYLPGTHAMHSMSVVVAST